LIFFSARIALFKPLLLGIFLCGDVIAEAFTANLSRRLSEYELWID
jgi:hypothetical protein